MPRAQVILLLLGVLIGILNKFTGGAQFHDAVEVWAQIDPHIILVLFLPTLIFESAFSIDFHVFRKSFWQIFALAVPGMALGTVLTAIVGVYIFPYEWDWFAGLMFGSILSATDPVAVVALLKELGASKQLETLIEGESLLNDGTAIVAFSLFRGIVLGEERTGGEMVAYGLQLSLGGPVLGAVFALASIVVLGYIYNDAVSEITVTLLSCYAVFIIAEATVLHSSGVLAVVTLGILMSAYGRVRISPEVEHYLHSFWEMMAYVSNTVIFLLSGVIIVEKTLFTEEITGVDWGYLILLYILLHVIRFVVIAAMSPVLIWTGYPVDMKNAAVLGYAGLRGAVGLSLGLIVEQTSIFDQALERAYPAGNYDKAFRAHVLFFVAGIAFLTLLINGSTTKLLLEYLGMGGESADSRRLFEQSCSLLNQRIEDRVTALQKNPQFHKTDWRQIWAYMHVPTARVYSERKAKGNVFVTHGDLTRVPPRLHGRWTRYFEKFDPVFVEEDEEELEGVAGAAKPVGSAPSGSAAAAAASLGGAPPPSLTGGSSARSVGTGSDEGDDDDASTTSATLGRRVGLELCGYGLPMIMKPVCPCLLVDRAGRERAKRERMAAAEPGSAASSVRSLPGGRDAEAGGTDAKAAPGGGVSVPNPLASVVDPATPTSPGAGTDGSPLVGPSASAAGPGRSRGETARMAMVNGSRRKFMSALRSGYWHRFEEGLMSRTTIRVLLDAVDWQADEDAAAPLDAFRGAIMGSIAIPGWVRFCHGITALGTVIRPVLFAQLQLLYDSAANFIATHEAAQRKSKYWALGDTAATINAEAAAEVARAHEFLESIDAAFPSVIRAVQTSQAVRALLVAERHEIESLARDGALDEAQQEGLLASNNASLKKATQHPPSHEVASVRQLIQSMPFARGVPADIVLRLKRASKRRLVKSGDEIFAIGQPAGSVLIVVSGTVRLFAPDASSVADSGFHIGAAGRGSPPGTPGGVAPARGPVQSGPGLRSRPLSIKAPSGKALVSRREGAGHILSLLAVLSGTPRLVSAHAVTPVETIEVPAHALVDAMGRSKLLTTNLWATAATSVAELFLDTFVPFSHATIEGVMASGSLVVPAGQGEVGSLALPTAGSATSLMTRAGRSARALRQGGGSGASGASPLTSSAAPSTGPPPLRTLSAESSPGTPTEPGYGIGGWITTHGDSFILLRGALERRGRSAIEPPVRAFRTIHPCAEALRFSSDALLLRIPEERMQELRDAETAEASLGMGMERGAGSGGLRMRKPGTNASAASRLVDGESTPTPGSAADAPARPGKFEFSALVDNTRRMSQNSRPSALRPTPGSAAAEAQASIPAASSPVAVEWDTASRSSDEGHDD